MSFRTCLVRPTVAGWQLWCHPPAHPQTHAHSWALSLTSISCSLHVFVSLKIACSPSFSPQFWPSVRQDASVSSVSLYFPSVLTTFFPTAFIQVLANTVKNRNLPYLAHTDTHTYEDTLFLNWPLRAIIICCIIFFCFDFLRSCDAFAFHVHAWQTCKHLMSLNHRVIYSTCFPPRYFLLFLCWFSNYCSVFSNSLSP